jgi:cytochrome oxidase Cu insertion factor (SCO1/SenC/PrrC family)
MVNQKRRKKMLARDAAFCTISFDPENETRKLTAKPLRTTSQLKETGKLSEKIEFLSAIQTCRAKS